MITIGTMNILDSFTPYYLTTRPFSLSAVNHNAGCKAAMLNVVMSLAVIVMLLLLTLLFTTHPAGGAVGDHHLHDAAAD